MRITVSAILLLFGVLLGCNDSAQTPTQPQRPSMQFEGHNDRAYGSGTIPILFDVRFRVSSHSGPLGEDPKGHMVVENIIEPVSNNLVERTKGEIICLAVLGNRAAMTMVSDEFPKGIFLVVEDNGKGEVLPDRADLAPGVNPDPTTAPCAGQLLIPVFPMEGDVVVRDALPLP